MDAENNHGNEIDCVWNGLVMEWMLKIIMVMRLIVSGMAW